MMRFDPVPEPPTFDAKARTFGNKWLDEHPDEKRPRDYWSPFRPDLSKGFQNLCGYSAMYIPVGGGQIDHYIDCKENIRLSYEWSNYRYCQGWLNGAKSWRRPEDLYVLDPYEIQDGWFEIILPSLQLVVTDKCPSEFRERVEYTLKKLRLRDHEKMIEQRQAWYNLYQAQDLSLNGLRKMAPLIARAVEKQMKETEK